MSDLPLSLSLSQNIDRCRSQELMGAHRRMQTMKIHSDWEWSIHEEKYLYLGETDNQF